MRSLIEARVLVAFALTACTTVSPEALGGAGSEPSDAGRFDGAVADARPDRDTQIPLDASLDALEPHDSSHHVSLDASSDALDIWDGLSIVDAPYPDVRVSLDAMLGRPDAVGGGVPCGVGMCAEGLTCCPLTGMCVPFGCPECCSGGPPPPLPFP
jgi:hypothetical protein